MFCIMINSSNFISLNKVKDGMAFLKQNVPNKTHDRRFGNTTKVNQLLM